VEKGELETSLTTDNGMNSTRGVAERGLIFGTQDEKAMFHQHGTKHMPARPPVGLTVKRVTAIVETIADSLVDKLRG
jgi:phage gpG-like protein